MLIISYLRIASKNNVYFEKVGELTKPRNIFVKTQDKAVISAARDWSNESRELLCNVFLSISSDKKVAYFFFESFQIVPPVRYLCPVTEDLPSQSKSLRKNMHVLLCGANNMQPLSWRGTNGNDPLF